MTKNTKDQWTVIAQIMVPLLVAGLALYGALFGYMNNQKTAILTTEVQKLEQNDDKIKTVASTIINSSASLTGKDDTQALLHYIALYEMVAGLYQDDKGSTIQKQHLMSSVIRMGAVIDKKSIWNYLYEKSNTDRGNFTKDDIEFIKQYAYIHLSNEQTLLKSKPTPTMKPELIAASNLRVTAVPNPMMQFIQENPSSNNVDNKFREGWVYLGPIDREDRDAYATSNRTLELYTTRKVGVVPNTKLEIKRKNIEDLYLPCVGDTVKASTEIFFRKQAPTGTGANRVLGATEDPNVMKGQSMIIQEIRIYTCETDYADKGLKAVWARVKIAKEK